jgi:hypothetical protein
MAHSNDLSQAGSEREREPEVERASQCADVGGLEGAAPLPRSVARSLLQRSALSHSVNAGVRAIALRQTQQMFGNHAAQMANGPVRAKLAVSEPGDPLEQQADEVADAIVNPLARGALPSEAGTANPPGGVLADAPNAGSPLGAAVRTPMVQRRLKMTGATKDIDAALGVLEPPSDLDLKHSPRTKQVSVNRDGGKPNSPELAGQLKKIIDDDKQHALVHVGRKLEDVSVGAYPDKPTQPQEVRIDQVLALERGAPGHGAAKLTHEIVENYEARALEAKSGWAGAFGEAHDLALATENLIEKELGHPGARRNTFAEYVDPPGKKSRFTRRIEDRASHFVVVDLRFEGTWKWSNARRVGRLPVSKYKIDGFSAGSASVPQTAAATIASLASDMKNNPTASAYVEGFASSEGIPEENSKLAHRRGVQVVEAVIAAVNDIMNTNWRRFEKVGHDAKKWNTVVITVERPDL